jgi:hypothetical protein
MTQTSFDQRLSNDISGLTWISKFGWLRTAELGRLMWPNDMYARTRADRVVRGWLDRGLVIGRALPDGAGRAFVLSEPGARLLRDAGQLTVKTGKDWGEYEKNVWRPDSDWCHDLIAAGVLVRLHEQGWQIFSERLIRQDNQDLTKIPDGLAIREDKVVWLEVEHARKSGRAMSDLANALCVVAEGTCKEVSKFRPNTVWVAYADVPDERGYRLNHRFRVTSAIQRIARKDVSLTWAACALSGRGVSRMTLFREVIEASLARVILEKLDANGWQEQEGSFISYYGGRAAYVWEDDDAGWGYEAEGCVAERAANKSEAMLGCANCFASDHGAKKKSST